MNILIMIKKLIKRIIYPHTHSSMAYIKFLRKKGIDIGSNCIIWNPTQTFIDIQRPEMLHIGDYCKITKGVTILTHDYSTSVTRKVFHEHFGNASPTYIGNNVFIGMNSIILMGCQIGNNCIIGAGSIVTGTFGDNLVIAGNPAKIICPLDTFYEKRRKHVLSDAVSYYKRKKEKLGRKPTIEEMGNSFAWLYLPRNTNSIKKYSHLFSLNGDDTESIKNDFLKGKSYFNSYNDFTKYAEDALN